jgi:hypothetical protein
LGVVVYWLTSLNHELAGVLPLFLALFLAPKSTTSHTQDAHVLRRPRQVRKGCVSRP